jgi:hypothetical protein
VVGVWEIRHNEELRKFYASPNTVRVIKSTSMRWAGHVACMGEMPNATNTFVGKPERRDHSEEIGVDGRIILEWILKKIG